VIRPFLTSKNEPIALSPSIAIRIIVDSPRHAYLQHRLLGNEPRDPTESTDTGNVVHALLLGGKKIVAIDKPDWRTKEAQIFRAEQRKLHMIPILQRQLDEYETVAAIIRARMAARDIFLDGRSEVAIEWESNGLLCHSQMDHVREPDEIIELKTCSSAHPKAIRRQIYDAGYDIQWAAYDSAATSGARLRNGPGPVLTGDPLFDPPPNKTRYRWVFAEVEKPYCVTVCEPDGLYRQIGRQRWERAQRIWQACLEQQRWPEYSEGIIEVGPPPWAFTEEMSADAEFAG
jgi:hypothetical protein